MGRDSQARGPEVLRGTGQPDPEDSLWMPGQLSPSEGQCGQKKNSSRRNPVFHDSVGGSSRESVCGISKNPLVCGQSYHQS